MIDTIKICSPFISEEIASKIESLSLVKFAMDFETGVELYRFTNKELKGSYDHRISIQIKRERFEKDLRTMKSYKTQCNPYLVIEGSIHKFILGHNVLGGSDDIVTQVKYLLKYIEKEFEVVLPNYSLWELHKIDYSEVFYLEEAQIIELLRILKLSVYPRRRQMNYGTSVMYPGTSTTLKIYWKGPEFKKHDRIRLQKLSNMNSKIKRLQRVANKILRIECSIKKEKLKRDLGIIPLVGEVSLEYIKFVYNQNLRRVVKESEVNMEIVRTYREIEQRLSLHYTKRQTNTLLNFWCRLSAIGEEQIREEISKATFYRNTKLLKMVGIVWLKTDVQLIENQILPVGFSLLNMDYTRNKPSAKMLLELKKVS